MKVELGHIHEACAKAEKRLWKGMGTSLGEGWVRGQGQDSSTSIADPSTGRRTVDQNLSESVNRGDERRDSHGLRESCRRQAVGKIGVSP